MSSKGAAAGGAERDFRRLRAHLQLTPAWTFVATTTFVVLAAAMVWLTDLPAIVSKSHIDWAVMVLAPAAAFGQYLGWAISLRSSSDPKPPFWQTVELEVAESVTSLATPESVGSMALSMRFLTRHGLKTPEAAASAGLNSFATTAVASVYVPLGAVFAAGSVNVSALKADIPSNQWLLIGGILILALVVTLLVKVPKLRKGAAKWLRTIRGYLVSLARQPARAAEIAAGAIVTAVGQVACMALILAALGVPVEIAAILVITQIANAASNVVPVPGGLGAPEAILVAGLASMGVHHDDAIIGAMGYRLCTYWVPPIPGMLMLGHLHRSGRI